MKKSDFHYELPEHLIAQAPLPQRSASRMLVVPAGAAALADQHVRDLPQWLQPGDLLVFNDTRVIPARLLGQKESGGRVEILIERLLPDNHARAQLGASKPSRPGTRIALDGGGHAEVLGRDGEFYRLSFDVGDALESFLLRAGRLPLPPYIKRDAGSDDDQRYQTLFARELGAVAAPTAGLHFDLPLLERLQHKGVRLAYITLHVGAGTFQPVRVENLDQHQMHSEWYTISQDTVNAVRDTRAAGRNVVAVGTTSLRALESASQGGELAAGSADTRLFITPGYRFRTVTRLITNFHLPKSTLLMLVSAFAGYDTMRAAYRHAIEQRYRFFSYGDAMLLTCTTARISP